MPGASSQNRPRYRHSFFPATWGQIPLYTISNLKKGKKLFRRSAARKYGYTPALPEGWVECSGDLVNDSDSFYNGYGSPRTGFETRPVNMSVVWIMR
ncbi:MAG: hypothetical protein GY754_29905 [bacterium]|nr:hypothetical protein [bacterium]